ncbi:MAG: prepilin-type N-terminal cleavage/methylation domain-containing protein [Syntrophomonadaceae bacterium]|nr:prepilin-type N-terminal cleavage/methylation domain-containing protein [Syntrophomonadaceae bacterium]
MRKLVGNEEGVTLIELLVVLALIGLVLSVTGNLYSVGIHTFSRGENLTEVQEHARVGLDYMERALREARELLTVENTMITFLDGSGQKLGFRWYNGVLYRDSYPAVTAGTPAASNPVAEFVDEVEFASPRPGVVDIAITTARAEAVYRLRTRVALRCGGGIWEQLLGE